MIKRLEQLKNTVNKYMAYIRTERKSVVSRRPSVFCEAGTGSSHII
jgi:hypothetical protein